MSDIEFLIHHINTMDGCPITKAKMLELIKKMTGSVVRFTKRDLEMPERIAFAKRLLSDGSYRRPEVRDRLKARYRISTGTAYTIINKALSQPPETAPPVQNPSVN